jgi:regulatory protein
MPQDSSPSLPLIITSVAAQKKNSSRCSVFVNGEFAFGCTIDTAVRFGLTKGKTVSVQEIESLRACEDVIALKQAALRYATYKSRTAHEVRQKMLEKDFTAEEAEYAVQFLEEFGYVNDRQYARTFIKETLRFKPSGVSRLRRELLKRGISKHDADDALAEAFPPDSERETAMEAAHRAAQKKLRALARKTPEEQQRALVGYLQRQGFSWEIIRRICEETIGEKAFKEKTLGEEADDGDEA